MITLSQAAILEKNKISNPNPFLVLLEITIPDTPDITIRVVHNNEDITWNGQLWQAFPFQLGDVTEDKQELPRLTLKICNIGGEIQYYLEQTSGGVGATVIFRVVHANHLDITTPEIEETFSIQSTSCDAYWVTFTLGGDYTIMRRVMRLFLKDYCPYQFKDIECGYNGELSACEHTLSTCRIPLRFGGEIGIQGGYYV